MTNNKPQHEDFCRRWKVVELGDAEWIGRIDVGAQFVVVRNKKRYRFIPLHGVHSALPESPIDALEINGKCLLGRFTDLWVMFTLEADGDDWKIGLSNVTPADPHLEGAVPVVPPFHGGPHGVDS